MVGRGDVLVNANHINVMILEWGLPTTLQAGIVIMVVSLLGKA